MNLTNYWYITIVNRLLTQDILVGSPRRGDSEPDDVDALEAGWHGVDVAARVQALQQTLRQSVVAFHTEGYHTWNVEDKT